MFGNPAWFRPKTIGWGLRPVTFKGWLYTAAWSGVIAVPFLGLLARTHVFEALVWLAASGCAMVWDVRQILRAGRQAPDRDILIIDDAPPVAARSPAAGRRLAR